ncbi:hypothetical protein [Azospirillum sp. B510]|uniref:hypothetical protein n=1 Tax=Azospirillum sp. (strain B510) TaxID=137722 RepID=UPI0005A67D9E|nr:hypothetical protein [Azospirillum sp. B510]
MPGCRLGDSVRASVRRHGLRVGVVFIDADGRRLAELRAGSLDALDAKTGGPFLGALLLGLGALTSPEQVLVTAYAGAAGLVAAFELLRASYAEWVLAPPDGFPRA